MPLESFDIPTRDGLTLQLHRVQPVRPNAPAVLLTHGGNTCSAIFTVPEGGLAGYLQRNFDVWLLDWRGSNRVVDPLVNTRPPLGGTNASEREAFSMDRVAEDDIPRALDFIRGRIADNTPLSIVAYCLSSGITSMAVARGQLEPFGVRNIVLLSLGLFYEVPWNGWIKTEDFILERVLHEDPTCRAIDPNHPERWPSLMSHTYDRWPSAWLPPPRTERDDMLRRLSFMVGVAWATENLHPSLRGSVREYFGGLHLGLYLQSGQMVRRGYAARMNQPEMSSPMSPLGVITGSDLDPRFFDERKRFTLICPTHNLLWHRDSMDLMFDWLRSYTRSPCRKCDIPGYNLHELLWGERAAIDVFPVIASGLG
jgi:pimeloyl-ACP methyl ester carboxylesterase